MSQSDFHDRIDESVFAHLRAHANDKAFTAFELANATGLQIDAVAASLRRLLGIGAVVQGGDGFAHKFTVSASVADRIATAPTNDDGTTAASSDDTAADSGSSVAAHAARRRPATTPTALRAIPPAAKSGLWAAN